MFAILHEVKKWLPYLIGRQLKVKIDHHSLRHLLSKYYLQKRNKNGLQMLGYDFEIIYKKGKQNIMADALLRKKEETKGLLCTIFITASNWV